MLLRLHNGVEGRFVVVGERLGGEGYSVFLRAWKSLLFL